MKQTAKEIGIEGRILNLSSIAHVYTYEEGIQFDNINDEDGYVCYTLNPLPPSFGEETTTWSKSKYS